MPGAVRAVLFDLDHVLLDSRAAWCYALEEAVAASTGRRIDARPLVDEYRDRPWSHALAVVVSPGETIAAGPDLCDSIMRRSALKKLLVHEGIGMALDALRAARIEMGAITRQPHALAVKQVQSTGLDRFLSVLAADPVAEAWDPAARFLQCLAFLEREASGAVAVASDQEAIRAARECGLRVLNPGWIPGGDANEADASLDSPASLLGVVQRM